MIKRRLLFVAVIALSGCRVHQVKKDPPPPFNMPAAFTKGNGKKVGANRWWEAFNDPKLNRLISGAVTKNMQVSSAWARILQAKAMVSKAAAGWQPNINAQVDASRRHSVFFAGGKMGKLQQTANSYDINIGASYEIDAWGRIASLKDAADMDRLASRMSLEALAMTISAQVAVAWFNLQVATAQKELLLKQLKVDQNYLNLVKTRYKMGIASGLNVLQQRQQIAAIRAQIPGMDATIAVLRHQLSVLLGRPPQQDVAGPVNGLDRLPPLPRTGIPAELLKNRPDLIAARMRIVATDHRLASAISDWLPALKLNASTGFMSQSITNLFTSWIWNLGASLVARIWDGGVMLAKQKQLRAQILELTNNYGQLVLNALKEVEDALIQGDKQLEYIQKLHKQLAAARDTLSLARTGYLNGLNDYLTVLTALQKVQQLEITEKGALGKALGLRVQLCRALGGKWTRTLKSPYEKQKKRDKSAKQVGKQ